MNKDSTLIAGILIAGAILLNGFWLTGAGRYQFSAAGTGGNTVWRMDTRIGSISTCGSVINGPALSQLKNENDAAVLKAAMGASKTEMKKVL